MEVVYCIKIIKLEVWLVKLKVFEFWRVFSKRVEVEKAIVKLNLINIEKKKISCNKIIQYTFSYSLFTCHRSCNATILKKGYAEVQCMNIMSVCYYMHGSRVYIYIDIVLIIIINTCDRCMWMMEPSTCATWHALLFVHIVRIIYPNIKMSLLLSV